MRTKDKTNPELFAVRIEALSLLEAQSEQGDIDLYYGDQTQVSTQGFVPYGWQFPEEDVFIPVCKEGKINCLGFINRANVFKYKLTEENITADLIIETLDEWSFQLQKPTVIVLDNARIHTARKVKKLFQIWQQRGLYIFYLPPYSPQLNIIERLWKEFKEGWLKPCDYQSTDHLFYAVNRICSNIGITLSVIFSNFNYI